MKIVLLDAQTFGDSDLSGFDALGDVSVYATTSADETLERVKDADVIVTNKVVIDDKVMMGSAHLKLICVAATGMNNIDLEAASRRNISVKNVAGYSTDSVIQHTFSMLFYLMGQSRYYDEYVKSGEYTKSPVFTNIERPFSEIKGKKWGIIGLGSIGKGVANIAKAFGAEVRYYSTSGKNNSSEFEKVSFTELLEGSDIISIHAPLNSMTDGLLHQSELLQLKDGAFLLNLGRGGIINEDALAPCMEAKELYIGLDVLAQEPMREGHPLLNIANPERLYITPHIAWASAEARTTLIASVIENIKSL